MDGIKIYQVSTNGNYTIEIEVNAVKSYLNSDGKWSRLLYKFDNEERARNMLLQSINKKVYFKDIKVGEKFKSSKWRGLEIQNATKVTEYHDTKWHFNVVLSNGQVTRFNHDDEVERI